MRIRIRGPSGQSTISLDEVATVKDLKSKVAEITGLSSFEIKYGYPPMPLKLDQYDEPSTKLSEIGVKLNGEQLIVSKKEGNSVRGSKTTVPETQADKPSQSVSAPSQDKQVKKTPAAGLSDGFSFEGFGAAPPPVQTKPNKNPPKASPKPLGLSRKKNLDLEADPPEIAMPDHNSTLVLRIMPDDNSCLFRAVGNAVLPALDTMNELRSTVAQGIQNDLETYSQAILDQKPDDYCVWIQTEDAWGGGIELSILSKHFDVEICSIDVQTLRVDRFNEGMPTRCIVVYSGIHYDSITLSPSDPPYTHATIPPEFDVKIFPSADEVILEKAVDLCRILQGKKYFTDTAGFKIKCNTCGGLFVGEKGATEHASQTGHYDFGEAD
jgi:ubiquitin thioesterase OTU1